MKLVDKEKLNKALRFLRKKENGGFFAKHCKNWHAESHIIDQHKNQLWFDNNGFKDMKHGQEAALFHEGDSHFAFKTLQEHGLDVRWTGDKEDVIWLTTNPKLFVCSMGVLHTRTL